MSSNKQISRKDMAMFRVLVVLCILILSITIFGMRESSGATIMRQGTEYTTDGNEISFAWDPSDGADGYELKLIMTDKEPHTDYALARTEQTQITIKRPRAGHFDVMVRAYLNCTGGDDCVNGQLYSDWTLSTDKERATVGGEPMGWWIFWKLPAPGVVIE